MLRRSANHLILGIFVMLCVQTNAQQAFQRLFTSEDRTLINQGCEPSQGGGFYSLNTSFDPTSGNTFVNMLLVTKHDPKGTLLWAREYTLKDKSFVTNLKTIDLESLNSDTIVITGSSVNFTVGGLDDSKYIFKIDPSNGDLLVANEISNTNDEVLPVTFPSTTNGYDSGYNYFASHSLEDSFAIQWIKFDSNDTILSQASFYKINEDGSAPFSAITDAKNTVDSNHIVSFISNLTSTKTSVMTINPQGEVLQADEYTLSPDSLSNFIMQTTVVETTPDTGFVQVGIIIDLVTNGLMNYIIKTDSSGNIQWSKMLEAQTLGFISQLNDVVFTSTNEIMLTGKYINVNTFTVGDFAVFLNQDGDVVRQWDYASTNSLFLLANPNGGLIQFNNGEVENVNDGGMIYSTVGFDPASGNLSPYFIKTDALGEAFCQDTLDLPLIRDYAFLSENISIGKSDFAIRDTFEVNEDIYDGFTVPVLTLTDTFFCPQDPINVDLDATIPGATSYEWSTGETSAMINVMEEGEFSVTVTIEDKICYALCDTANINKRDFPEATIDAIFFGECELDSILLRVGANNSILSLAWSTGDSTNSSIFVKDPGLYSVTIIDNCNNSAEAQINISDATFNGAPDILDVFISGRTCLGSILNPTVIGFTDGITYEWSTGETTPTILVDENGNYSLTVTNSCGNTDEITINVQNLDPLTVDIESTGACDSLELVAKVPLSSFVSPIQFEWSDGTTTSILDNISGSGLFSVTVTDACGTTATDEYAISDTIVFPDVFFGGSVVNPENRTFGPFIRCPEFFEGDNYSLEVYNRFGNRVFETNSVGSGWNGIYSGDIAPRDVYMYQWSYDLPDGTTINGEGTVTLLR